MKEITLNRQQLYDLVWAESVLSLSKKYAISDVGLRKKCKSLEIPLPDLGYWAKIKYGKKVIPRRPLKPFNGDQTVTLKLREENDTYDKTKESRFALVKEIEADTSVNLTVPEKLTNPDKLIISVKDDLYKSKVLKKEEGIVYSSQGVLDINVSPTNIGRALRIMDTLIKALKNRGHDVIVDKGQTWIVVDGEKLSITCREKLSKVIVKGQYYDQTEFKASGLLSIRIEVSYDRKEWVDGKTLMENQLSKVIAYLEMKARQVKEERTRREQYWAEQREKDRIAKEVQEKKVKELSDFNELFRKARRHDNAEKIRRYANEWEQFAITNNLLTEELKEKIEWVRKKADWYDPFIEAEDELMKGIDREELKMELKTFYWLNK